MQKKSDRNVTKKRKEKKPNPLFSSTYTCPKRKKQSIIDAMAAANMGNTEHETSKAKFLTKKENRTENTTASQRTKIFTTGYAWNGF